MLKLVKYLREFGWEPIVYTAENAAYPVIDESLEKDIPEGVKVLRNKIREPYGWYKKFTGKKSDEKIYSGFLTENKKPSLTHKISVWIRGNFFIPDARCFWIEPSIKFLTAELTKNPVDAIISSGPPHSVHLIAKGLKEKFNIPWLADFRDPWTQIDFYDHLMLTKWADARHRKLEKAVLQSANSVMTVGWHIASQLEKISGRKVEVVTNGFDDEDFEMRSEPGSDQPEAGHKKFVLAHIGSINADRNSNALWQALKELTEENSAFKNDLLIRLVGKNDFSVYQSIEENNLSSHLEKIDYLPHDKVMDLQRRSSVLLLLLNNTPGAAGIVTGKLFEYLAARRPILVIGPENGDAARIVKESGAGEAAGFGEKERMREVLVNLFRRYKNGTLKVFGTGIERYSRKKVAEKIGKILDYQVRNS